MSGFLALPREVSTWFPGDGLQWAVYVYLCDRANWADATTCLPKQKVRLKAGQLVISQRDLATYFGVSHKRIRIVLDKLATPGPEGTPRERIGQAKGTHGSIITIVNYKELFLDKNDVGHTKGTPRAHEGHYQDIETRRQERQEDTLVDSAKAEPTPFAQFLDIWNKNRGRLASVQKLTTTRKGKIRARWTEQPDMDYWVRLVQRMATSTFCCQGSWATFDWLMGNDTNHVKVGEGKYDDRANVSALEARQKARDLEIEKAIKENPNDWAEFSKIPQAPRG